MVFKEGFHVWLATLELKICLWFRTVTILGWVRKSLQWIYIVGAPHCSPPLPYSPLKVQICGHADAVHDLKQRTHLDQQC